MASNLALKPAYVLAGFTVLAACGALTLVTLLTRGVPESGIQNPDTFWLILMVGLAVGGIFIPLLGALPRVAPVHALRTALFFVIPALTFAVFLDPRLSAFPVQFLCVVGIIVGLLGTIVTLFDALEARQGRRPSQSRMGQ